jgi:hypothetical protein
MALNKHESQLADASDKPLIGARQAAIADVSVTGTYATDDTPIVERLFDSIIAALVAHGLIEEA